MQPALPPLLGKLFGKVAPLLDDPLVVHPRSIVRPTHHITTGYGEDLRKVFTMQNLDRLVECTTLKKYRTK